MHEEGEAEVQLPVTFPNGVKMNVCLLYFKNIMLLRLELM
jgi:hypothetical protein